MPPYHGMRHSMEVGQIRTPHDATPTSEDWAAQYQAYLEEKGVAFETNSDRNILPKTAIVSELEEESWTVEYAKYCEERERDLFGCEA